MSVDDLAQTSGPRAPEGLRIARAMTSWDEEAGPSGRPVLVMLHGHAQDADSLVPVARPVAEALGLDWVSLQGPLAAESGHAWLPSGTPGRPRPDDVAAAVDLVGSWCRENLPDTTMRLAIGFSEGGVLAGHLLRNSPDDWAGAALLASYVMPGKAVGDPALRSARPPVFCGRGADDEVVPADVVARTEKWLRTHATATERTYRGQGHRIGADMVMDLAQWVADVTDGAPRTPPAKG